MAAPSTSAARLDAVTQRRLPTLAVAALGVVFGDIGTSPLYALHVCFLPTSGVAPTEANVLGVLSLMVWSLIVVVSVKYVVFVMRADLNGEGGVLALMELARRASADPARRRVLVVLGLCGAALLYGDGMLTPAISVLSAVEGIKIATPVFQDGARLIAVLVLVLLFTLQHRGTGRVGAVFGPVMVVWFLVLIALGLRWIGGAPQVLEALSPHHAAEFLRTGGVTAFLLLGSVFLAVTGGEALYADIGHFGTRPIRVMWFALVLPAVVINYFGQGAMLLQNPHAVHHTFFELAPRWALVPLLVLATAAAVIASQAVISGAFSLTYQALQLGYCPRIEVRHGSEHEEGQVYVPLVNWVLLAAAVGLVLYFKASDALAGAYGVAVSGTMVLTTVLAFVYFGHRWGVLAAIALALLFLPVDLAFLSANLVKIDRGGWFPLLIGALGYVLFRTWTDGQERTAAQLTKMVADAGDLAAHDVARAPGTAVYLSREQGLPRTLLLNMARNHVLHEQVIVLTVKIDPLPRVARSERREVTPYVSGLVGVVIHYGYLERPNVPAVLAECEIAGRRFDIESATFFQARVRAVASNRPGMAGWRKRLYAFMARNAQSSTALYRIPADRVMEIGIPVEV